MEHRDRRTDAAEASRAATNPADRALLARLKRMSLADQSRRVAWQLGSLLRRVEREAPEVSRKLRSAAEALQLLGARLELADEPEPGATGAAGADTLASRGEEN